LSRASLSAILGKFMRRWILILGAILVLLGVAGFFLRSRLNPAQAGLQIETIPRATVFIDGNQVGTTPYEATRSPGELTLRLVPESQDGPLAPWDTKLTLTQGIKTVVKRDFAETESLSSGEILSFEKIEGSGAALIIVSSPDAAKITLDGEDRGFTPLRIEQVAVGEHQILISHPGFLEREIKARTEPGFRLTVVAMLAEKEMEELDEEESLFTEAALSEYSIQVLNGSGVVGEAGRVRAALGEEGFEVTNVGNAGNYDYTDTEVRLKGDVPETIFDKVKKALADYTVTKGEVLDDESDYDVVVTVGVKSSVEEP